ncbi:recombinase family protein [Congzhengia minquanensis]|uniref:Recombinase family protein n=1 Tax=Congzhengia minquanensis TaxID=2763657 RepID=A0A926HU00_9FIRM|nr:recombinase family protein [Congzhengia minquanensis]
MSTERKVTIIEPISQKVAAESTTVPDKLRVAAYARVSTEQDEQQSSYEAQVDFYTRYIQSNPNWEFVSVFADEGITGTNTKKRDGFNLMIQKALNGEIDLILTKSISRFARNTVDTLQTVRELKAAGVEVIFEKENLHTFDPKCEVMLTIMSSLAQEESRSISENVRWGKQKSMRDGKVTMAYSHFLGYRKGADGRPEIVEEEAIIIRKIYDLFLSGKAINEIASFLTEMDIPTPAGKAKWSVSTVRSILSNEKYKGDALLQKTYTVDYLTKEVRKNDGEVAQYLVQNSHDAIIEPEVFDKVQELLAEYSKRRAKVRTNHPFAGKIICGDCGGFYGHKVWRLRSTGERYNVWYCNHKYDGNEICDSPRLRETEIKAAFEKMLQSCGDLTPIYTDERWNELVQSVRVYKGNHLIFTLTSGEIVKITL